MTHAQSIKYAAEIKALQEGKVIQSRPTDYPNAKWFDNDDPDFDTPNCDYRIKPEPLDGYINLYASGPNSFYASKSDADSAAADSRLRCVHVREVVE